MKKWLFILTITSQCGDAQNTSKAIIKDSTTKKVLNGVTITVKGLDITSTSNAKGLTTLQNLSNGSINLLISYVGYKPKRFFIQLPDTILHEILMETDAKL